MRRFAIVLLGAALAASVPAPVTAAVTAQADSGFSIENSVDVAASPAAVFALLGQPARWWNGDHSYSGNAGNLSLDARVGGCFCEALPRTGAVAAGRVEHARVIHVAPASLLRLVGSLGPLQAEAVTGTLSFSLKAQGAGTKITMSYVLGGFVRGGAGALAEAVDQVLAEQLARLKRVADMPG